MATQGDSRRRLAVGVGVARYQTHLISYNRNLYGRQSFGIICKLRSLASSERSARLHEVVTQLRIRHAAASPVSAASGSP